MPKLSGFMQGLNLNLGKEKEERKVSLIAGLALNPSGGGDLPWAALTSTMALCKRARRGGISNPQIPTARLRRELVGSGCQRRSSPCRLAGLWPPKTLGCCLGAATTMRRGSGAQPGAGWEHPRAPPAPLPEAWARGTAARRAPAESLLAPAPAQRSQEHRGDVLWICHAGGAMYRPKMGRGEGASPRAELAPQPPASPESRDAISFPLLAVPSGPGPLVVGGEGRLVQPGVTGVLLGLPGVPCTFGAFGVPLLGARRTCREGRRGARAAGAGAALEKVKQSARWEDHGRSPWARRERALRYHRRVLRSRQRVRGRFRATTHVTAFKFPSCTLTPRSCPN